MGTCPSEHPDHRKELSRINRISGQLDGIKKMIEDRRYCPEVLTQLQAVRGGIKIVGRQDFKNTYGGLCSQRFCVI